MDVFFCSEGLGCGVFRGVTRHPFQTNRGRLASRWLNAAAELSSFSKLPSSAPAVVSFAVVEPISISMSIKESSIPLDCGVTFVHSVKSSGGVVS